MAFDRSRIREGMTVFSSDGENLGKVSRCDASSFTIEKGFFFPKDYVAEYEAISDLSGDDIRLSMTKETFVEMRESGLYGTDTAGQLDSSEGYGSTSGSSQRRRASSDDINVTVAEEELDVVKHDRQSGEVRLRKEVVTETKRIDVPVTREEVHVERVPVDAPRDARPGEARFEGDSVSMPLREEEIEIRKRPVVKEEVRLRKERVTEQRASDEDVRKERVHIEGDGGAHRVREEDDLTGRPGFKTPRRDDDLP